MANSNTPKVIAVTGAAGYVGRQLLPRLLAQDTVNHVLATDVRPLPLQHAKLTFLQQDITQPLAEAFERHGVGVVVHLAFMLRPSRRRQEGHRTNVEGCASVLQACHAAGVRRIVSLSSSTVYGPHPDNPQALGEEAPPRPPYGFPYAWDKLQSERLFQEYTSTHPDTEVSILRACVIMGPFAQNFITTALFKPVLIGIRGHDPPLQYVHEADMIELLGRFISEPHPGVYNVAGPGTVRWSQLARMAHRPLVWLPATVAYPLTSLSWWLRLQGDSPAAGLDFIRYPWVVSTERLEHEMGHQFRYTAAEALEGFLATAVRR